MATSQGVGSSLLDRLNSRCRAAEVGSPRRGRWRETNGSLPAVESLEPRVMLSATAVSGAWNGGDFDSVGVFEGGLWQLDLDGDGFLDSPVFAFGLAGDKPIAGDWNGNGVASVGVFRNGIFYLDMDDDRQFDASVDAILRFGSPGDIPVAGNWDGVGGDEIGVFRNGLWCLDVSGNGVWGAGDVFFNFGLAGDTPVAGNWDPATSNDSVGVYRNGIWSIDRNKNFSWDGQGNGLDQAFLFGTSVDKAFAGDFLGDNTDEVAILQDPPVGDPQFFVRELSWFDSNPTTFTAASQPEAQATTALQAEARARTAASTLDDDLRDSLFAEDDELL